MFLRRKISEAFKGVTFDGETLQPYFLNSIMRISVYLRPALYL